MPSTTRTIRLHPLLPPTEHHGDPLPNLQIPTSSTPATLDLLLAHLLQQPQKKYTYTLTSGQIYNAQKQQPERIEDVYYSPTESAPQKIGEIDVEGFVHAVGIYEEGIRVGTRNDIQQYTLSKEMQVKIKGHTTAISETHHALITGEILHTKHQHKNSYYAHDAKPTALLELDGNLVAAYDDGAIVQHEIHQNVSTNKRKKGVAAHKIVYTSSDKIYAMKNHSINPQVVIAAGNDVRFVDLEVGNVVQQRCFSTVAFDVDIKNVMTISGHADKTIKLFDARENVTDVKSCQSHTSHVTCVAWNPDSEYEFASGSLDKTVKVWDMRVGKALYTLSRQNKVMACDWRNGLLVSGDHEGKIEIFETQK